MSANTIERRDASEIARRLAETAHNASSATSSPSEQKCVDPRDERAVGEHAYLATHAMNHDGEGAEAIMHAATMVDPH